MAIDTTELKAIYDDFLTKGFDKLIQLQKDTQMEDEHLATASSSIVIGAMAQSSQAYEVLKRSLLVDEQVTTEQKRHVDINASIAIKYQQELAEKIKNGNVSITHTYDLDGTILTTTYGTGTSVSIYEAQKDLVVNQSATETNKALDVLSMTTARNELKDKDKLIKDQQELAERLKNGGVSYVYGYDLDGVIISKTLVNGTGVSVYEAQIAKALADTSFVKEQELQLGYSVTYNNRLKTLENYSDTLGNLGIGGFVLPTAMWTTYFGMINDCYVNYGDIPATKTFTVATDYTLTKA
jgi:hypothetical protein